MNENQSWLGGILGGALDFLEDAVDVLTTGAEAADNIADIIRSGNTDYLGNQGTGGSGQVIPQDTPVLMTGGFLFLAGIVALVIAFAD